MAAAASIFLMAFHPQSIDGANHRRLDNFPQMSSKLRNPPASATPSGDKVMAENELKTGAGEQPPSTPRRVEARDLSHESHPDEELRDHDLSEDEEEEAALEYSESIEDEATLEEDGEGE